MSDIHTHFSFSYANYLVLPRTLLQSMPAEWQHQFVALLEQMDTAFVHQEQAEAYEVIPSTEHIVGEMTDLQLKMAGISADLYGGEKPSVDLVGEDLLEWQEKHETARPSYSRNGEELDAGERVLIPTLDPVPHYNRGRTHVEPRLGGDQ
ncbi:hypothetical protein [Streptomyces sp. NPDC048445]|uniref:hypothetical protein n=1 Tax=Streptomyces sp. NPDC048445 TaxID=3365553 RepID=UPI003711F6C1